MNVPAAVFLTFAFLWWETRPTAQTGQASQPGDMVGAAVQQQMDRPLWFHPFTMLLPGIPYAYDATATLTVQREGDAELIMTAVTKQELVLGEAWQDIRTTQVRTSASGRDHQTLTGIRAILFQRYRGQLTTLDRERLREPMEALRSRNVRAWDEFLRAFRFERVEDRVQNGRAATVFSFTPLAGYQPLVAADAAFYSKIKGQVWIDNSDFEIVRLAYEFSTDSPEFMSFGPIRKKTRYSMDISKSIDGAWLPVRSETELFRRNGSSESHETYTVDFGRYRKFDVDVKISIPDQQP